MTWLSVKFNGKMTAMALLAVSYGGSHIETDCGTWFIACRSLQPMYLLILSNENRVHT